MTSRSSIGVPSVLDIGEAAPAADAGQAGAGTAPAIIRMSPIVARSTSLIESDTAKRRIAPAASRQSEVPTVIALWVPG